MGILEWLGAHLLAPVVSLYRAFQARPRSDIRIIDVTATGGGKYVNFWAGIENLGTQQARVTVTARVGDREVEVIPQILDVLVNAPPTRVAIKIPRPDVGDLVPEFNGDTTLYGQTLTVEAKAGKHRRSREWRELVYDAETNLARHELQQLVWRRGRGGEAFD